jgi:hypothetical protein
MRHSDDKDPEVAELEALLRSMRLAGPSYGHEDRMSEIFQAEVEKEILSLEPRAPSAALAERVEEALNLRMEEILAGLKPAAASAALDEGIEEVVQRADMESRLQGLKPFEPSEAMDRRIETALRDAAGAPAGAWRLHNSLWWAAAAALLLIIPLDTLMRHQQQKPAQAFQDYSSTSVASVPPTPVKLGSTRELPSYEGAPIKSVDGSWVRPVLNREVESEVWVDPDSGAVIEREIPREVINFVPVHFE